MWTTESFLGKKPSDRQRTLSPTPAKRRCGRSSRRFLERTWGQRTVVLTDNPFYCPDLLSRSRGESHSHPLPCHGKSSCANFLA